MEVVHQLAIKNQHDLVLTRRLLPGFDLAASILQLEHRRCKHRVGKIDLLGVNQALAVKLHISTLMAGLFHAYRVLQVQMYSIDYLDAGFGERFQLEADVGDVFFFDFR